MLFSIFYKAISHIKQNRVQYLITDQPKFDLIIDQSKIDLIVEQHSAGSQKIYLESNSAIDCPYDLGP